MAAAGPTAAAVVAVAVVVVVVAAPVVELLDVTISIFTNSILIRLEIQARTEQIPTGN